MNSTFTEDSVQQMDLSVSIISSDLSWNDELQSLNLNIAEKNRLILEQECKINEMDVLVEKLMKQILRHKLQERRLNNNLCHVQAQCRKLQEENKRLKFNCGAQSNQKQKCQNRNITKIDLKVKKNDYQSRSNNI